MLTGSAAMTIPISEVRFYTLLPFPTPVGVNEQRLFGNTGIPIGLSFTFTILITVSLFSISVTIFSFVRGLTSLPSLHALSYL